VVGVRATLLGVGAVLLVTAAVAWGLGREVKTTNIPPYPAFFYPDSDGNLNVTQTVQLTNYWLGALGAALWIVMVRAWRLWRMPLEPVS
jgi:hypothetical protein